MGRGLGVLLALVLSLLPVQQSGAAQHRQEEPGNPDEPGSGAATTIEIDNFTAPINRPGSIAAGPSGTMWFVNGGAKSVGRVAPDGTVSAFSAPGVEPSWITAGPDGNMWFSSLTTDAVGRITPDGVIQTFTDATIDGPQMIAAGPDGNLWFVNKGDNSIGRITPGGVVSNFSATGIVAPSGVVGGSDGNIWFTDEGSSSIWKVTPDGVATGFEVASGGTGIALGADGNVWFTIPGDIVSVTPTGDFTAYPCPCGANANLTADADGHLWLVDTTLLQETIVEIDPDGALHFYPLGVDGLHGIRSHIAAGPDGFMWYTIDRDHSIRRLKTDGTSHSGAFGPRIVGSQWIAAGPDGNIWFTNEYETQNPPYGDPELHGWIGRVNPQGAIEVFGTGAAGAPQGIAAGADGNMWITNIQVSNWGYGDHISRMNMSGVATVFQVPNALDQVGPQRITQGPDGNMWFTGYFSSKLGRITPDGSVTLTDDPAYGDGIATGPDGRIWLTRGESGKQSIKAMALDGTVEVFTSVGLHAPLGIAEGADGNMWFTNRNDSIGRVTPSGEITIFSDPAISSSYWITAGPDGNMWFTDTGNDAIGRITPSGVVTEFTAPSISDPRGITAGADGNIWFTNFGNDSIGRVRLVAETKCGEGETGPFSDVPGTHQFCADVDWMAQAGIAVGFEDGTFGPTLPVSRQAMAAFLRRAIDDGSFVAPATATFSDVGVSDPFFADVEWLAQAGIALGFEDGTFGPTLPVSRQAMAAFLNRALN